jgi:small subunit ribosomal protein S21
MTNNHNNRSFENKRGLSVEVRNNNFESALRTFGRKVKQEGLLREVKQKQFYEKPSDVRRKKQADAVVRQRKALTASREL